MAKINASDVTLLIADTEIGNLTNCELEINREMIDVTTKDNGNWKAHLVGLMDWNISGEITIDFTDTYAADDVVSALIAGTDLSVKFGVPGGGNYKFVGTAHYTQAGFSAGVQDKYTAKFSAEGTGALSTQTTT